MTERKEVMPTEADQKHILPLAQAIIDLAQDHARKNGMTFQAVMSSLGTAAGALIGRAYTDQETAEEVAGRMSIAALEFVRVMHWQAERERTGAPSQ